MATSTLPPLTEHSPRGEILEELERCNFAAKNLRPSPAYDLAHERINVLLDWLVGR